MERTGKMAVVNDTISGGVEILNRPPYEGVSMTLDESEVFKAADVVKAGSLIDKDGKVATSADVAVGILLYDVYKRRPQGTILKKAYVNLKRIKESIGDAYDGMYGSLETIKAALPMIVFEEDLGE